jgi:hypothetical protein
LLQLWSQIGSWLTMEELHWCQKVVIANADFLKACMLILPSLRADPLIQLLMLYGIGTGFPTIVAGILVSYDSSCPL